MPPGCRERLQPRGDVDAVAIHIAVGLLDHVAQMHADAKAQAAVLRGHRGTTGSSARWIGERRGDRAGGGLEDREHRVAGGVR